MSTPASEAKGGFATVGVVGAGLVGGSFALVARNIGAERICVVDRDADVRGEAIARGIADEAFSELDDLEADLVVVAVPGPAIADIVIELLDRAEPPIVVDTGSTKSHVVGEVEGWWVSAQGGSSPGLRFVGGHPMAGSEVGGIASADPTLFQGAPFVLTPTDRTDVAVFRRVGAYLREIGCRVIAMAPDAHDRLVGIVSHLPQVIASSLVDYAAEMARADPGLLAIAGGGFRDVTRLASSDPELWTGILRENRSAVLDALDGFAERLGAVRGLMADDRWAELTDLLGGARDARELVSVKDVPGPLVDLVIPVEDRPGALAEISTALGASGINIEDLSMRHAETEARGALIVSVAGVETARRAAEVLNGRGYASHVESRS